MCIADASRPGVRIRSLVDAGCVTKRITPHGLLSREVTYSFQTSIPGMEYRLKGVDVCLSLVFNGININSDVIHGWKEGATSVRSATSNACYGR